MPGHCRPGRECVEGDPYEAKDYLGSLAGGYVECRRIEIDHYGRAVSRCEAEGRDLSCEMLESGYAVRRYSYILCL